jgi:hypothetical protein
MLLCYGGVAPADGTHGKSFDLFAGLDELTLLLPFRSHGVGLASVSAWAVMKRSYPAPCKEKSVKMLQRRGRPRSTRHVT